MKKQLHILKGLFILTTIFLASLLFIKFLYKINNEQIDTDYLWNIKFNNIIIEEGSQEGKIDFTDNNLSLEVELSKETEYYEFTIDIENSGTLNAKLDTINLAIDNPKNILKYQVTYLDGTTIKKGDIIESQSKKTIKIRIDYPKTKEKIYDALRLSLTLNMKYIASY